MVPPSHGVLLHSRDAAGNTDDPLYGFEGIVVPGGQMIIGRWWAVGNGFASDIRYGGPFLAWNVD